MPKHAKSSPAVAALSHHNNNTTGSAAAAGLPTPAQSTEIHAKPAFSALSFDGAFALPPAAISSPPNSRNSSIVSSDKAESDSSYNPDAVASSSAVAKGRQAAKKKSSTHKSSAALAQQGSSNDYTVPPPPTRSRKIIQMKPRGQRPSDDNTSAVLMAVAPDTSPASIDHEAGAITAAQSTTGTTGTTGTKRKQATSSTTAQGRKMARKTAHSLIERRRRSKMNEEFGVLKDMIPACAGQEMHKLAILQASIDYMRYLEKCLADLKTAHASCASQPQIKSPVDRHTSRQSTINPSTRSSSTAPPSDDSEMLDLPPIREVLASNHQHYKHPPTSTSTSTSQSHRYAPISPAMGPLSSTHNSPQYTAQKYQPPLPGTSSIHPSPLFEGQQQRGMHKLGSFSLTSPIVQPMVGHHHRTQSTVIGPEEQEEATAALLMLNTDRRSWSERASVGSLAEKSRSAAQFASGSNSASSGSGSGSGAGVASARSMSVRDLLTG